MYKEINNSEELKALLTEKGTVRKVAFQDMNFKPVADLAAECWYEDCLFLGGDGINVLREWTADAWYSLHSRRYLIVLSQVISTMPLRYMEDMYQVVRNHIPRAMTARYTNIISLQERWRLE